MNVGHAITAAMREQRRRDANGLNWSRHRNVFLAWWWWGWSINGRGGLGYSGSDYGLRVDPTRPVLVSRFGVKP